MDGFCRGCLNQYNDPTELLQYTEKNRRLFVYSTGIQVKRNDVLTFLLCKDCYLTMKVSCKFKKMCRNSDKRFRSYLSLKDTGEVTDLNTFLKNNDDSLTFRLPLPGSGTPNIKIKEEDNESTCTSIQNFISDIMETEDIPATEARIIREVIEEEADVLDDSLDSHWLQDDVSIETDFKLDFSFSPFSTPNYINNDHCYTPKKLIDDPQPIISPALVHKSQVFDDSTQEFLQKNLTNVDEVQQKCTIDKNLENALQDETNENFYLNDLLVTPPLHLNVSGPPTPLITNILFGDKLEENEEPATEPIQCSDNNSPVKSESKFSLFEEFFTNSKEIQEKFIKVDYIEEDINTVEHKGTECYEKEQDENTENIEKERERTTITPDHPKYSVTNFYCKMCEKQFKNLSALKVHCTRKHKFKIKHKTPYIRKVRICDSCGKSYHNLAEFITHVHNHNKPPSALTCKFCTLMFSSEAKLKMHMSTHPGKLTAKPTKKKYVCSTCGSGSSSAANLKTHQLRHSKSYVFHCSQCGRGFYRRSDLDTHMRHHTGEKPFTCQYCERCFGRRDVLNRHMKGHTDERPYKCQYCDLRYAKRQELKYHIENGKACREKRREMAEDNKEKKTHSVSVYYGTVNGIDIRLDESKKVITNIK